MTPEEARGWIRLARSRGVGPRTFAGLVARYADPEAALAELPERAARAGRRVEIADPEEAEAERRAGAAAGARLLRLGGADRKSVV